MIKMQQVNLDRIECQESLNAFRNLLEEGKVYGETFFLSFFKEHPNLILLMGSLAGYNPEYYQNEFNIFNEFYADFAIANSKMDHFTFVELEDDGNESVFREKENEKTKRYVWSPVFEHGYSQIIDWFYRLDDYSKTNKIKEHFNVEKMRYEALLIVGRNSSLPNFECRGKLDWRSENVDVHKKKVFCLTYDELYNQLSERYQTLVRFS